MCVRECAECDIGECLGKEHGFGEGADWEVVLARCDGCLAGAGEDGVNADGVEFFLLQEMSVSQRRARGDTTHSDDGGERLHHIALVQWRDIVARDVVRHVRQKLGEEGHFEELVHRQ